MAPSSSGNSSGVASGYVDRKRCQTGAITEGLSALRRAAASLCMGNTMECRLRVGLGGSIVRRERLRSDAPIVTPPCSCVHRRCRTRTHGDAHESGFVPRRVSDDTAAVLIPQKLSHYLRDRPGRPRLTNGRGFGLLAARQLTQARADRRIRDRRSLVAL